MKTSKLILSSTILFAILLSSLLARGPGGNGAGAQQGNQGGAQLCPGYGPGCTDPSLCTGAGPCGGTGVPVHDGSGKSFKARGNPNSNGTPLRDGSGRASAPGKGAKDGSGPNAACPNPAPKS